MAKDERAAHRKLLTGDAAPDPSEGPTTYIQFRRYNRATKKVESVPGLSVTLYGYEPAEAFAVFRPAIIAYNDQLKREAEKHDQQNDEQDAGADDAPDRIGTGAGDGAESEGDADERD